MYLKWGIPSENCLYRFWYRLMIMKKKKKKKKSFLSCLNLKKK